MLKKLQKFIVKNKLSISLYIGLILIYFFIHLFALTRLPVFADESIYIRWAQLIIDDWKRYLFFSMNDGKTPLFIWLLVPFQYIFKDQLFAGRFLAVLVGLIQVFVNMDVVKCLGGKKSTQLLMGIFTIVLPFWYFHHQMALMDGLLALLISISYLFLVKVFNSKKSLTLTKNTSIVSAVFDKSSVNNILISGFFFGLALLTKIPAILFIPSLYLSIFLTKDKSTKTLFIGFLKVSVCLAIGIVMFFSLKLNPTFGQLFSRGGDFLFPISDLLNGSWLYTVSNVPNYLYYFYIYLTPGIIIFALIGLFSKKNQLISHVLFWSGLLFIFPIALMGKTVYPRYLFPASFFFTLSAVMGLESLLDNVFEGKSRFWKKVLIGVSTSLILANIFVVCANYIQFSILEPNKIPFVSSDITQYLTEWSSGHGIKDTVDLIEKETTQNTLAVATEGYFGTLPDGLLMYLHRTNVDNLYLEGIGQPVSFLPKSFADRANNYQKKWLIVNSHRLLLKINSKYLIAEFCRPYDGPCLQVWDLTENFDSYIK
ncbi:MAG: glycosyltransferase family 39 protein [Pseudomonadales bacterium]|nr:glycosyltransferase family 39 protein [Pseudomonadales bacterium]